jgi:four helix bundle protein
MALAIKSYRDLLVWQKGMDLVDVIDEIVTGFGSYQRFWLGSQMLRAALSIPSNIAEGHGSDYRSVYAHRLSDAKGSTTELETQVLVAVRRGYGKEPYHTHALELCDEVGRMLRSLNRSVRAGIKPSGIHRRR